MVKFLSQFFTLQSEMVNHLEIFNPPGTCYPTRIEIVFPLLRRTPKITKKRKFENYSKFPESC